MEKQRLLKLLKSEPNDVDAIGMILSNYTDYGHSEMGGMVSVKQFDKVAECLIEWWNDKTAWQDIKTLPANDDDFCTFARFDNKGNIITSFTGTLSLTRAFRKYELANQYTHWIKLPAPLKTDKTKP